MRLLKHAGGCATVNANNVARIWSDAAEAVNGQRAEAVVSNQSQPFTDNQLRDLIDALQSGELDSPLENILGRVD